MPEPGTARLFFALWPDPVTRRRLEAAVGQATRRFGGRPMRPDTLHLTLLFLGAVARDRLDSVRAAGQVGGEGFGLCLEDLDCWRHNSLAHLRARQAPASMLALVEGLRRAMLGIGLAIEKRPFVAHVTLSRKAVCRDDAGREAGSAREAATDGPVEWPVGEYVLVESRLSSAGPRYHVLERYPLTGIRTIPDGRTVP